jgi:hypothetical protein
MRHVDEKTALLALIPYHKWELSVSLQGNTGALTLLL